MRRNDWSPLPECAVSAVRIGVMHLVKCLEFKAVAVMACDDRYVPLQERIEAVADEVKLDTVVACTRARDWLHVSAIKPGLSSSAIS